MDKSATVGDSSCGLAYQPGFPPPLYPQQMPSAPPAPLQTPTVEVIQPVQPQSPQLPAQNTGYSGILWSVVSWFYDPSSTKLRLYEQAQQIEELRRRAIAAEETASQLQALNETLKRKDVEWAGSYATLSQANTAQGTQLEENRRTLGFLSQESNRLKFELDVALDKQRKAEAALAAHEKGKEDDTQGLLKATREQYEATITRLQRELKQASVTKSDLEARLLRLQQLEQAHALRTEELLRQVNQLTEARTKFEEAFAADKIGREQLRITLQKVHAAQLAIVESSRKGETT